MTESGRWHTRAGVTRIRSTPAPDHRVLLLDSRRDGLPARTEDAIAGDLGRAGLEIDLDAVSDPRGMLRVLEEHPQVLDGYDAVVGVVPHRADWRGSSRVLTTVLERVSARIPTLLVDHEPADAEWSGSSRAPSTASGVHTLVLPADHEAIGSARLIAAALLVLLGRPSAADAIPPAASGLRERIGAVAIDRLERITHLARESFGLAVAEVNLLQGDMVVTVVSAGALPRTVPADDSLCVIALRNAGITVMADTWLDAEACRRIPTHEPGAVRFYAACPIRSRTGAPIGMLCIWDFSPHDPRELDIALLNDLALLTEGELISA